ncbi:PAS domain-containing protein [Candidatus Bathyarchaeota archaeon]|nr:PAS domain-containing protein [Candidatus Bathyarchaeota archaeon]
MLFDIETCRLIYDKIRDAIIIVDDINAILYLNPRAERLTGWALEDATGIKLHGMLGINRRDLLNYFAQPNKEIPIIIQNSDLLGFGEEKKIPVTMTVIPVKIKEKFLKICIFTLDEKLETSMVWDTLSQVWDFSRAASDIIDSIPSALFICKIEENGRMRILNCNQPACKLTGRKLENALNYYIDDLFAGKRGKELQSEILATRNRGIESKLEYREYTNDEITSIYRVYIFKIPRRRVGIIFEDITLLEMEKIKLKEVDRLRSDFVLNATHELKTPLMTVGGASEFLIENFDNLDRETINRFLMHIKQGYKRLNDLFEDLLDFSRIDTGRLKLEKDMRDLCKIVHEAVNSVRYLAKNREHTLTCLDGAREIKLPVDAFRIEQVIVNLLSNAIKNTPTGGKIEVQVLQNDGRARVEIKDNGIGFLDSEIKQIFKKFGKIDRKNIKSDIDIQGSGLGLFISKEIIEMHGGRIWVESKGRNKGSTFIFEIPPTNDLTCT